MSDIQLFVMAPVEKMKDFNERLRKACEEAPVTDYKAVVVDGHVAITLISEEVEADEALVAEALKAGRHLKVGELVPVEDPIIVQAVRIGALGKDAADSEQRVEAISKRAEGDVEDIEYIRGAQIDWMQDRNDLDDAGAAKPGQRPRYVQFTREVVYAVITYLATDGEEE